MKIINYLIKIMDLLTKLIVLIKIY